MEQIIKEASWKKFYRFTAVVLVVVILTVFIEMTLTLLPSGSHAKAGTDTAEGWMRFFESSRFMAMRNLGLINMIATALMLPVYFALYGLQRKAGMMAAFALAIYFLSFAIFMADNPALPVNALFDKYQTVGEGEKEQILSAVQAMTARGANHTQGSFPGFILSELAGILMCAALYKSRSAGRLVAVTGLVSFSMLAVFEVMSSFIPEMFGAAMILAAIAGILALAWYVMLLRVFIRVSKKEITA